MGEYRKLQNHIREWHDKLDIACNPTKEAEYLMDKVLKYLAEYAYKVTKSLAP